MDGRKSDRHFRPNGTWYCSSAAGSGSATAQSDHARKRPGGTAFVDVGCSPIQWFSFHRFSEEASLLCFPHRFIRSARRWATFPSRSQISNWQPKSPNKYSGYVECILRRLETALVRTTGGVCFFFTPHPQPPHF